MAPRNNSSRRAALIAAATAALLSLAPATALAQDDVDGGANDAWSKNMRVDLDAAGLGLRPGASSSALAKAAIARSRGALGLGRATGLRLAVSDSSSGSQGGGAPVKTLRFQQTVGGRRVLWSELDVVVSGGRVASISATTVRLKSRKLSGRRRIRGSRAVRIARRAVRGRDRARSPELVAYAGDPARPKRARLAYVVQVALARPRGEHERNFCIVVDAKSGKVIARWTGTAARQRSRRAGASTASGPRAFAAARVPLYELFNFKKPKKSSKNGKLHLDVRTVGSPFRWGELDGSDLRTKTYGTSNTSLSLLNYWTIQVTRYFCLSRGHCGRIGSTTVHSPHFFVGRYSEKGDDDSKSFYQPSDEHITMGDNDSDDPDLLAHEMGHSIDFATRNDLLRDFEGREVEEALGDMFQYDFDRDGFFTDGKNPSSVSQVNGDDGAVVRDYANPANAGRAANYSQYSCSTGDIHDNGTILSHAYYRLTTRIGHLAAGRLLQDLPRQLPAKREFGDVRQAFEDLAEDLYPGPYAGSVEQAVDRSFDEVGVVDSSRRTKKCPGKGA